MSQVGGCGLKTICFASDMDDSREKDRDRSKRGDRPSRFSDAARDRSNDRGDRSESKRLFVSNIPYEFRWTELKDLFKEKVSFTYILVSLVGTVGASSTTRANTI